MRHLTFALLLLPALAMAQVRQGPPNAGFEPAFEGQTRAPALDPTAVAIGTVASGLEHPWGIALLPDGSHLVTERPGRLRVVGPDGTLSPPVAGVPEVDDRGQGGLLDVAVRDDFAETRRLWLTYAKPLGDGLTVTAAGTGVLSANGTALEDWREIFVQDPPSRHPMHYGSRIAFEPGTGNLWITTGEHSAREDRDKAQDIGTTYGKIVRVDALTGAAPADNPFVGRDGVDTIWSWGHRNVQGAAVAPDGTLWTLEHGPAGGDELNRPEPGRNYGWPVISYGVEYNGTSVGRGEAVREGMEQPVYYWDPVIAPGGMTFYDGSAFDWQGDILASGLAVRQLVRLRLQDGLVVGEERIDMPGRVRDVEVAPDGTVLILIDAADGAILRVSPG